MISKVKLAFERMEWRRARTWRRFLGCLTNPAHRYLLTSRLLRHKGRFDAAEVILARGRARHADDLDLTLEYARIATARGDWQEATRRWKMLVDQFGPIATVDAYASLAQAHRRDRDFRAAEAVVQLGSNYHPGTPKLAIENAKIATAEQDWPLAEMRWREFLRNFLSSAQPEHFVALSNACRKQGRFTEAEVAINEGRANLKGSSHLEIEWAEIATNSHDWSEAATRWRSVLELRNIDRSEIVIRLGLVYRMQGASEEARLCFNSLPTPIPSFEGYGPIDRVLDHCGSSVNHTARVGPLCVHLHLFHLAMLELFADRLRLVPHKFSLAVSVPSGTDSEYWKTAISDAVPNAQNVVVLPVVNRGRDVMPWTCQFREIVLAHDIFLHVHTKVSGGSKGLLWSEFLLNNTLGSASVIENILGMFEDDKLGLVYPPYHHSLKAQPNWGKNWVACDALYRRLFNEPLPEACPDYPAGSFFWARSRYLKPILDLSLSEADFPAEAGQYDGTLAHAIERILGTLDNQTGLNKKCIGVSAHMLPAVVEAVGAADLRRRKAPMESEAVDKI